MLLQNLFLPTDSAEDPALNAGQNTRRFPAIVLLLIGCLRPTELRLIKAPKNRDSLGWNAFTEGSLIHGVE